jgi:hypothetical protein
MINTDPIKYSEQLRSVLNANPGMTIVDLANRLVKSPMWVAERLKLLDLPDEVKKLVSEKKICLTNAYAMTRKVHLIDPEVLIRAQADRPNVFIPWFVSLSKSVTLVSGKHKCHCPDDQVTNFGCTCGGI